MSAEMRFSLVPLDPDRLLQPGSINYVFDLEVDDPGLALMTEMPMALLLRHREALARLVREELKVPLVVVVTEEER